MPATPDLTGNHSFPSCELNIISIPQGGRNDFGGRNVMLFRDGKQYCLYFKNTKHKGVLLKPGDSIQVEQKAIVDRWKGTEEGSKVLME